MMTGFKSRAGKPFTASLKLDDGQARFDFDGSSGAKADSYDRGSARTDQRSASAPRHQTAERPPEASQQDQTSRAKRRRHEENEGSKRELEKTARDRCGPPTAPNAGIAICPKCGQGQIIEGRRGYGCNRYREGCNFVVWKEIAGLRLTEQQIHGLITERRTPAIAGFVDAQGNRFSARIELDDELVVRLTPAPVPEAPMSPPLQ